MLELKTIDKTFNQGTVNENKVLNGLSLTLEDGDYVTVIGGNGAGKSTLLNIIAGVATPDSGSVFIDGEDVTKLKECKRAKYLGRVFQDPMMGTAAKMSINENLALAARRGHKRGLKWGLPKSEESNFKELLALLELGLEERLESKIGLLSGGQRQAITLLMATINKPKLLLLDEHTAALDPKTAAKVLEITDKIITKYKLTTVMITHNMRDAIKHGNRLIMLDAGRVILDIKGEQKQKLTVDELLKLFEQMGGEDEPTDSMLLS
ncbi:MAG: ATP-binding cassette domain-containing protein [Oscillospiraceae bacterium]